MRFRRRFRRFRRRSGILWCRARSGSAGFRRRFDPGGLGAEPGQAQLGGFGAEPGQVQQDLRPFNSGKPSWGVSSACNNKTFQLLGIPPKLFFMMDIDGYGYRIWYHMSFVFLWCFLISCHIFHMLCFHIVVYDGSGPLINIDQHRTPPRSSEAWKSSGGPTWRRRPCDNFWACSSWRKRRALCAGGCRSMMKYRGWVIVMVGICWDWLDYVWLQRETQGPVKKNIWGRFLKTRFFFRK